MFVIVSLALLNSCGFMLYVTKGRNFIKPMWYVNRPVLFAKLLILAVRVVESYVSYWVSVGSWV